jgi:hypothetical protein
VEGSFLAAPAGDSDVVLVQTRPLRWALGCSAIKVIDPPRRQRWSFT